MSDVYSLWSVRMHFSRSCVQKSLLSVQSTMKITISMTGWTKFRILPEAIWIRSWPHSKKFTAVFPGRIVNAAHLRRFTKLHSLSAYVRWYRKCCLCVCKLFLCRKITSNERLALLKLASEAFPLKLYTHQPSDQLPHAEFMGPVDYYSTMPLVFRHSRINLNITLKASGPVFRSGAWILWEVADFCLPIFKATSLISLYRMRTLSSMK